ncbi:MAG: UDP-N-acetylmuramate dehydrogenase [Oscillospiraceae bacterium]|nr:UDP-N-acetylmuramate dehydrogenase [Oscillospiraceae bacterium]
MKKKLLDICSLYEMQLQEQVPLSEHTTFHIGGKADFWIEVSSVAGLSALVRLCKQERYPFFVLGKGSNILASDAGYRGLILHLGAFFTQSAIETNENIIIFGAGMTLLKASKTAEEFSLSGMEGLCGIPGTVGGALYMNAGAYGYEMAQIVESCEYMDMDGEVRIMTADEMALSYRYSWFTEHPGIILRVTVRLTPGVQTEITAKMHDFLTCRSDKQPLNFPSAGSTFKRPAGSYASMLIDQCGLKGYTVGGAQVSEKHAGFVINRYGATCEDVLQLCADVRRRVAEETSYELELEPILLGFEGA